MENQILSKAGKIVVAACILIFLGSIPRVSAAPSGTPLRPTLPAEFGEVIYQKHGERPNQIFIVGQSHRSAITGANGSNTVQTQADIYHIGEWLIRHEGVSLLLPEGYFRREKVFAPVAPVSAEGLLGPALDRQALVAELSDTRAFINADILLKRSFNVPLQQVEDEGVYQAVREFMSSAGGAVPPGFDSQLDYLQEIRSAAMLQNIPDAIDSAYQAGGISQKRAMFSLGMAHLDEIIRFLQAGEIRVPAPPMSPANFQDYAAALKLIEAGYGVTVILPRALIDDREALRMVRLDSI